MDKEKSPPFILRLLCTIYLFLSLLMQWLITWLVQTVYIIVAYPFTTNERRQDICGHIFRFISFVGMDVLNPFWEVRVLNKFPKTENKKVIVMMNHLSGADPFVAIRSMLPRDGSWIAKDELFRVPLGGWSMANAGDLAVKFKNKKEGFQTVKGSVGPMMEEARKKLRRGRMLCVFPEGIRSKNPEGPLNPFRPGFFSLAIDEGAVIVPLAISGTERLWPRGSPVMNAATAYFSFGEPIDCSKYSNAEELMQYTWDIISGIRDSHPDRVEFLKSTKKVE
ncbi:1-acyl-sn-glycerol-3-phosphateacyltransferase-l ik eprotein [Strigomonas culicis]|uniref:1-acyl-sn-glycerol-3-phosphateacyltransferase-l ik eprotein n=1 Tax=Strigomonas culicis TaxID=28005 RepID=S9UW12_9TRYP|nr:1-acyl-sn-glycerol-3-phosphateacyltransferase-l ik eprotein [Strigomonas culicis]|eukprot:EPY32979.1 1-acyl-sn-glycerol-3-phosphateacyltransferase-l ik eprotein [Strigomonas culicis]